MITHPLELCRDTLIDMVLDFAAFHRIHPEMILFHMKPYAPACFDDEVRAAVEGSIPWTRVSEGRFRNEQT
jgi:hypothetical protein